MPNTQFTYETISADESKYGKNHFFIALAKKDFVSFNSSILGIGDVSEEGRYIQALAAFYDLEGFSAFSNQVDSHLVVPEFLKRFIDWLFTSLADEFKEGEKGDTITLWSKLPFFTKFLGDGILLLWDTAGLDSALITNIIGNLHQVSTKYRTKFLPDIRTQASNPPRKLRCGVARGQIISIGHDSDYVGSCINIASRLQKLGQLSFAVSRRGVDLSRVPERIEFWKRFVLKKVPLRGIGDEELVYIDKAEFRRLPSVERKLFKDP